MRTLIEIKQKEVELQNKLSYLRDFLSVCYKGSDAKEKTERELIALKREINIILWVIDEGLLPF